MWGTATINISRTGDEEYDTQFGGEQQQRGDEMVTSSVIGENEEEAGANDTSKPFPLPPDIFAEVQLFHIILQYCKSTIIVKIGFLLLAGKFLRVQKVFAREKPLSRKF